jgi:hypothetical protein
MVTGGSAEEQGQVKFRNAQRAMRDALELQAGSARFRRIAHCELRPSEAGLTTLLLARLRA